jgi:selenocysteine lyase/cysteine desulfurase
VQFRGTTAPTPAPTYTPAASAPASASASSSGAASTTKAGATVTTAFATTSIAVPQRSGAGVQSLHERFEDGTINYMSIAALEPGFDWLQTRLSGGMQAVAAHTQALARVFDQRLRALRHANGQAVVKLYTSVGFTPSAPLIPATGLAQGLVHTQGPTFAFNLLKADGSFVGYAEVERLASANNIQLRVFFLLLCSVYFLAL